MIRHLTATALLVGSAALLWTTFVDDEPAPAPVPSLNERAPGTIDWYAQRNWDGATPGSSKLSVFVFRDRNRDGVLDPGDLPMSGIAVSLARPDGGFRTRRSNINGYTNFTLMAHGGSEDITVPDAPYHWAIQVPDGWQVTTGNEHQSATFRLLQNSLSGMVTDAPPTVVGLAPDLTVSGCFDDLPQTALVARNDSGAEQPFETDEDGRFSFSGHPGEWTIEQLDGEPLRRVSVNDVPVVLSRGARNISSEGRAPTALIDFEVLNRSVIEKLPVGHRGLGWDYLLAIDNQYYKGPGYVNVLSSGRAVGYNSSGYPVTVSVLENSDTFDFEGGRFAVAWAQAEGETLELEGWRDGERIYSDDLALSHLGGIWFAADYRNIDRLVLRTRHYWQFTSDDLIFRVPEKR